MKSSFVRVAANLSRKLKRKSIIILPTPNNEREYLKVVFPNPDQETESRNATMETEQKPRTPRNIKQCGLEKPLPLGFWNFFPPEQPPHPESRAQVALIPEPSYAEFQTLLSMSRYTLVDNARTLEDAISSGIPFLYAASDREEMLQTQIHERIYSRNVVYLVDTFKTSHESELPYRWTQTASDQLSRMKTSDLAGFFESLHRLHIRDRNLVLLLQSILDQKLH